MMLLKIYEYFNRHRKALWCSLTVITAALSALVPTMHYSENIRDFLPLGTRESEALDVYQNISGADRIVILFGNDDPDIAVEAMDSFVDRVREADADGLCSSLSEGIDMQNIMHIMNFTYENMPYFLQDEDYERIDSLLKTSGWIRDRLQQNKNALMMFSGGFASASLAHDPLGLFSPVMDKLGQSDPQAGFHVIDGYIFTPDMSRAILTMKSPFGGSETEGNAKIVGILNDVAAHVMEEYPDIDIRMTGGPVIAVGNSSQIKKDSMLAISLSVILIMLLLIYSFNSFRNIILIFLSIGWGWLFALGCMAAFNDSVSIIVIGISSVILGIAVNYPLHLIAHTQHQKNLKTAIKEISAPLIVGNITTIGAFLALVPLRSVALKDLGLFASLLLAGTIMFVLVYLPHFVRPEAGRGRRGRFIGCIASFNPHRYRFIVIAIVLITAVLGYFSTRNSFNSNMADINYMTEEQRADMNYFRNLFASGHNNSTAELYLISGGSDYDEALAKSEKILRKADSLAEAGIILRHKGVSPFLPSRASQEERLNKWQTFASGFKEEHMNLLLTEAASCGFAPDAFRTFLALMEPARPLEPQNADYFEPFMKTVLSMNLTSLDAAGKSYVVDILTVPAGDKEQVMSSFDGCFDMTQINSSMSDSLSDNFNYIGWACSLIVFFFLWLSFGRLELAIIAFLPMAVSWIWILGLMYIFGIQFNIVNVILATFIFGQGDDYTIFMTEGCQFEYANKRPILASYKAGIIQSAMIMFVGIGTLIIARHPAMRSLAVVTIIGMASVVLMAYLIPPFLFAWLTTEKGRTRKHPLTLACIFTGYPDDMRKQVYGRYIYKGAGICRHVKKSLRQNGYAAISSVPSDGVITIADTGYGELAILAALSHPEAEVIAVMHDEERRNIASVAADDFVDNIKFKE